MSWVDHRKTPPLGSVVGDMKWSSGPLQKVASGKVLVRPFEGLPTVTRSATREPPPCAKAAGRLVSPAGLTGRGPAIALCPLRPRVLHPWWA